MSTELKRKFFFFYKKDDVIAVLKDSLKAWEKNFVSSIKIIDGERYTASITYRLNRRTNTFEKISPLTRYLFSGVTEQVHGLVDSSALMYQRAWVITEIAKTYKKYVPVSLLRDTFSYNADEFYDQVEIYLAKYYPKIYKELKHGR